MNSCTCAEPRPANEQPGALCLKCDAPIVSDTDKTELLQASDPKTNGDLLGQLSFSKNPAVLEAVIANPNAPRWAVNRASTSIGVKTKASDSSSVEGVQQRESSVARIGASALGRVVAEGHSKAEALLVTSNFLAVFGVIGGILLLVVGMTQLGNEEGFLTGVFLVGAGITGVLIWIFVGVLGVTIAAGVKILAADVDNRSR